MDPSGSALAFSTFLGGSAFDDGQQVAIDTAGHIVVAGQTSSSDFETFRGFRTTSGGAPTRSR